MAFEKKLNVKTEHTRMSSKTIISSLTNHQFIFIKSLKKEEEHTTKLFRSSTHVGSIFSQTKMTQIDKFDKQPKKYLHSIVAGHDEWEQQFPVERYYYFLFSFVSELFPYCDC